eukprot:1192401-Prorocentrum_minimum.AAC.2
MQRTAEIVVGGGGGEWGGLHADGGGGRRTVKSSLAAVAILGRSSPHFRDASASPASLVCSRQR